MKILEKMTNNKRTLVIGGVGQIMFLVSCIQVIHHNHLVAVEKNKKNQSKYSVSKPPVQRLPAQDNDEILVEDLRAGRFSGNIFGPRGLGRYIVKINRKLKNTKKSYKKYSYSPLYFSNDHCHIFTDGQKGHSWLRKKRYGINYIQMPIETIWARGILELTLVNHVYARPGLIMIAVHGVSINTPISEIEQMCNEVITIRRLF